MKAETTVVGAHWRDRMPIAEGVRNEAPKAPRWVVGMGFPSPRRRGFGKELQPSHEKVYSLQSIQNIQQNIAKINITVTKSVHNWNAEMALAVCY